MANDRQCSWTGVCYKVRYNDNNQPYLVTVTLDSKADKPCGSHFWIELDLECWSLWREEDRRTRSEPFGAWTRTNNKLDPHVT